MGWTRCVHCEKFRRKFVAQTSAPIALVQHSLHQVSCINEMILYAPKHHEMLQNMCLGSNGVDRMRTLRQILTRLRGTNFCINCTSSAKIAPSCNENSQMHPNTTKPIQT